MTFALRFTDAPNGDVATTLPVRVEVPEGIGLITSCAEASSSPSS